MACQCRHGKGRGRRSRLRLPLSEIRGHCGYTSTGSTRAVGQRHRRSRSREVSGPALRLDVPSAPGHPPPAPREGIPLCVARWYCSAPGSRAEAYPLARDPTGVGEGVDLSLAARPHPGRGARCARERKQYRYHAHWRNVRDETKYGLLVAFGTMLPTIRRRVREDLAQPGLPREKVIAVVVQLLELTMMRVGNEEYARSNHSFGLTTPAPSSRELPWRRPRVPLPWQEWEGAPHASPRPRLARIVKACQDIPGYELFQYLDEEGQRQTVDSAHVNAYLREISGAEMTAKVFRTWAGTVRALAGLRALKPDDATEETKTGTAHIRCRDREGSRESAWQYARHLPQAATSIRP